MKAVGFTQSLPIDDPKSLVDAEVPEPKPAGRDLLVEVKAVSVNPVDTKRRMAGMKPAEVAARIVDGVRENRFFIATHTATRPMVEARHAELMAAYDAAADWRDGGSE